MSQSAIVVAIPATEEPQAEPVEATPTPRTEDEIRDDERENVRREMTAEQEQSEQWQKMAELQQSHQTILTRLENLEAMMTQPAAEPTPEQVNSEETSPPVEAQPEGVTQLDVEEDPQPAVAVEEKKVHRPSIW